MKRFSSIEEAANWLQRHRVILTPENIQLSRRETYGLKVWGAIDYLQSLRSYLGLSWNR
jgi:hypothetical protein